MKVSIITPAFNSSATIARCIESVKSQDYIDIEHIIIDGGATMNPPVEDFVKAIHAFPAKAYVVLPNNKNILLAAEQL